MSAASSRNLSGPRATAASISVVPAATDGSHLLRIPPAAGPRSTSANSFVRRSEVDPSAGSSYALQGNAGRQEDLYEEFCKLQEQNAELRTEIKVLQDLNTRQAYRIQELAAWATRRGRAGKAATAALETAAQRVSNTADYSGGVNLEKEFTFIKKQANNFVLFHYLYAVVRMPEWPSSTIKVQQGSETHGDEEILENEDPW
ncbi:hypothetical protein CPC08DRAFT_766512 [Agrocybe pediades]|nr:hypothetical protein CPC08DRAFT_766512 [Agrocybe pediades]